MNYINADLRKNNLSADVADTIANTSTSIKSGLENALRSLFEPKAKPRIYKVSDYYAKAPVRSTVSNSIERELAAKGNAW